MNRSVCFFILVLLLCDGADVTKPVSGRNDQPPRNGVITGRVILEDGSPAEGVLVMTYRIGIKQTSYDHTMQEFRSDREGNFKATGLVPGLYELSASLAGYVHASSSAESTLYRIGEHVTINLVKGGVITGVVTDANGEPMIGEYVYAYRMRDSEGRPLFERQLVNYSDWDSTDDRGIYRIYGLYPGSYILRVNAGIGVPVGGADLRLDAPTYYPSASRAAAVEINVRAGDEVSGINIQQRNQRGSAITGILTGEVEQDNDSNSWPRVTLLNIHTGHVEAESHTSNSNRFVIYGVADGEYTLFAHRFSQIKGNAGSSPIRIQMRGADLTGIELKLNKFASISGRISIEPPKTESSSVQCQSNEKFGVEEIFVEAKSDAPKNPTQELLSLPDFLGRSSVLVDKGEFNFDSLVTGRYRIVTDLPGENWYVRAINQPAPAPAKGMIDVSRTGIAVKRPEKLSGVEVVIAGGAASLKGRVVYANDLQTKTDKIPLSRYRVHLIPAEKTAAENILQYAETFAGSDGAFTFKNMAPGKYRLLARPLPEADSVEVEPRPAAWDAVERVKLLREAGNDVIELRPCQGVTDYVLQLKK